MIRIKPILPTRQKPERDQREGAVATSDDYATCRRVMRAASKNYAFASLVLSHDKIHHVEALYALLRVGDDLVDVSHDGFSSAVVALDNWERTYWQAFETHTSAHPVMRAYLETALIFDIPPETMTAYFRAMREDLTVTRYPMFDDLLYYMEGSAIPVGRAMVHILGVKSPYKIAEAIPHADSLAIAMQLSNFWRDIGEDWERGRVYIPQEDMARFGVTEEDLRKRRITPAFIELLDFEIARATRYYDHAVKGIRFLASGRWGVHSGLRIYRAILTHIRRHNYDVFSHRAGTNLWQRVGHVLCALGWTLFAI